MSLCTWNNLDCDGIHEKIGKREKGNFCNIKHLFTVCIKSFKSKVIVDIKIKISFTGVHTFAILYGVAPLITITYEFIEG